jgi:tetrapyrrole methylase family protein/MazG family protein
MGKDKYAFNDLVEIMKKLRSPEGCPWDREQTHESLVPYLIEETYEVVDAIAKGNYENLKEELGDLLLQVVFHSQIASEEGKFTIDDVIDGICKKLIFRHPHVFGDRSDIKTSKDVLEKWEEFKEKEGKKRKSLLDGIPESLPALDYALKLQKKAAKVGFDWEDFEGVKEKLLEEIEEIEESYKKGDKGKIEEEVGDLLFMVVNLARKLNVNPEMALRKANKKFVDRFSYIEEKAKEEGRSLEEMSLEEMEKLWQEAKQKEQK